MLSVGVVMRYVVCGALLGLAIAGAYYGGYAVGSRDVKIEYITQEKEVIKYVEKEKAKIHSTPAASPNDIVQLFNDGIL